MYTTFKTKKFKIHQLVAKAFIPNPKNHPTVNHFDEIKTNNRVENLGWFSVAEQSKYSRGINITLFIDNQLLTFPSINEAAEYTGLENAKVKKLANNYANAIETLNKILTTDNHSLSPQAKKATLNSQNTSGYTGINFRYNKWTVRLTLKGTRHHIGEYSDLEMAVKNRDKFIIENNMNIPISTYTKELVEKGDILKNWILLQELLPNEDNLLSKIANNFNTNLIKYIKQ